MHDDEKADRDRLDPPRAGLVAAPRRCRGAVDDRQRVYLRPTTLAPEPLHAPGSNTGAHDPIRAASSSPWVFDRLFTYVRLPRGADSGAKHIRKWWRRHTSSP